MAGMGVSMGMAAAGAALASAAVARRASSERTPLGMPAKAVDSHVHVFDPDRFPYSPRRGYTPPAATVADLRAFERGLGVERVVLVQPSPYGSDNSCLLAALRDLGPDTARGVAVIDPETVTDAALDVLEAAGVVAVRVNLATTGIERASTAGDRVSAAIRRVSGRGLSIQIYLDLHLVESIAPILRDAPVPIILDHYGGAVAAPGPAPQGFATLLRAMERGNIWVKLSAPYRASRIAPGYPDVAPLARALLRAAPERLVWASDWPHTGGGATRRARTPTDVEPFRAIDDAAILARLRDWCGSDAVFGRILATNPATLFRFA